MAAKHRLHHPRRLQKLSLAVLLLTVVFFASGVWAQASDDDDEDGPDAAASHFASLTLHYNARGTAEATFTSDVDIQNWGPLQTEFEKALHCPAGTLSHSGPQKFPYLAALPKKQRARFEEQASQRSMRTLEGTCPSVMSRNQFLLSTGLPLDRVMTELQRVGEQKLFVNVTYQPSKYSELTRSALGHEDTARYQYTRYELDVASATPSGIHLEFGLHRRDAIRAAVLPTLFLILPIVIMFWMQHAAVRDAQRDPTAAWFSYFRALNWCNTALMVIWVIGHSVRQGLEDLAAYYLAGNDVSAIALKVAILLLPPWIVYVVCVLSSYRVCVQVRGNFWTRGEFITIQLLRIATRLLPIMCLICGLEMMTVNGRVSIAFFLAIYFTSRLLSRLSLKYSKAHPEALTTGELRDRVFDLAKRAAVELRQIFIMPAEKSQLANAFASQNRIVIFTDYLLSRLK